MPRSAQREDYVNFNPILFPERFFSTFGMSWAEFSGEQAVLEQNLAKTLSPSHEPTLDPTPLE